MFLVFFDIRHAEVYFNGVSDAPSLNSGAGWKTAVRFAFRPHYSYCASVRMTTHLTRVQRDDYLPLLIPSVERLSSSLCEITVPL